jgi:AcrR family transcriptional regulator
VTDPAAEPEVGPAAARLIDATTRLLAEQGPSAIKARNVAAAAGLSTMAVYSHFGGIPELTRAVTDHGFTALGAAFAQVPITDDPVADLAATALTCRRVARESPHLYDLMFGLSNRATYRPLVARGTASPATTQGYRTAYALLLSVCARLVESGRVNEHEPAAVASQLWSLVHGFITLELAGTFTHSADPVRDVLFPLGVNFVVGLGDSRELAERSHLAAAGMS